MRKNSLRGVAEALYLLGFAIGVGGLIAGGDLEIAKIAMGFLITGLLFELLAWLTDRM